MTILSVAAGCDWSIFSEQGDAPLSGNPKLAVSGLLEILSEVEMLRRKSWILPELADVICRLSAKVRGDGEKKTFSRKEIVLWVVCEIMETEVGFDEVYE